MNTREADQKTTGRSGSKEEERGRSRTPKGATRKQRGRVGGDHPLRGSDGRYGTLVGPGDCPAQRAHVCEFCLEPHRTVECPRNPGWRPPPKGVKRQHDTILKSATSEKVSVVGCSPRGVPLESAGKGGRSPSVEVPILVRGTLLEVPDHRTSLLQEVLRRGLQVHQLSGVVDVARVEPFDDVKVVVKRVEVDWLHIVPSASWSGRMGLTKLCKIALRKGIWWSVHILPRSLESGCVAGFVRALNDLTKDPTKADVLITTDNCEGSGVLVSQRSAREHENEQAVGGLRNAARAVDRVPGWSTSCRSSSRRL